MTVPNGAARHGPVAVFLADPNPSLTAKGVLATIASRTDDHEFTAESLAALSPDDVAAVASALRELENAGLLTCSRRPGGDFYVLIASAARPVTG